MLPLYHTSKSVFFFPNQACFHTCNHGKTSNQQKRREGAACRIAEAPNLMTGSEAYRRLMPEAQDPPLRQMENDRQADVGRGVSEKRRWVSGSGPPAASASLSLTVDGCCARERTTYSSFPSSSSSPSSTLSDAKKEADRARADAKQFA